MENKLDAKDYEILRELDSNFRQSFSKIGKKVRLSKNSVALRFEKLKDYTLHNMVGLNNELMGYTLVKAYYSFDFYNDETEKAIVKEARKHKNIQWVARYYGTYDIGIGLMIDNINDLVFQVSAFDEKFAGRINKKEIQIIFKHSYFRYNFLYDKPLAWVSRIDKTQKKAHLNELDKKIIRTILYDPRMNIVDVARILRISPKTVSNRIKEMERLGVIMGYFATINPSKFGYDTFKLLIQLQNSKRTKDFEEYLSSLKNTKYIAKMIGIWDYEVDMIYHNMTALQDQIEIMKGKFPNLFKRIEIMSLGKRIFTNNKNFLA